MPQQNERINLCLDSIEFDFITEDKHTKNIHFLHNWIQWTGNNLEQRNTSCK